MQLTCKALLLRHCAALYMTLYVAQLRLLEQMQQHKVLQLELLQETKQPLSALLQLEESSLRSDVFL